MTEYKLQPCCIRALEDIRRKQDMGKLLQGVLAATPFALLLGSGPIETTFSVTTTDWNTWAQAVGAVPAIVKNRIQLIAGLEVLNHPGGPLNEFWRNIYDKSS